MNNLTEAQAIFSQWFIFTCKSLLYSHLPPDDDETLCLGSYCTSLKIKNDVYATKYSCV